MTRRGKDHTLKGCRAELQESIDLLLHVAARCIAINRLYRLDISREDLLRVVEQRRTELENLKH
jgi:hypothetical protein